MIFSASSLIASALTMGDASAVSAGRDKQKVAWLDVEFLAGFSRN
jgi:hypothetical protein